MKCHWCNINELPENSPAIYCSDPCRKEATKIRNWCTKYDVPFTMPRTQELVDKHANSVFVSQPWDTGDTLMFEDGVRERMKTLRALGMTLDEIHNTMHFSIETVRSILEHEI